MVPLSTQAIIAGGGCAVVVVGTIVVLALPTRQHDPQRGQAVGCLMMVAVAAALVGGLVALGAWQDWPWLVSGPFWGAVFVAGLLAVNAARYPFIVLARRRAERQRREDEARAVESERA